MFILVTLALRSWNQEDWHKFEVSLTERCFRKPGPYTKTVSQIQQKQNQKREKKKKTLKQILKCESSFSCTLSWCYFVFFKLKYNYIISHLPFLPLIPLINPLAVSNSWALASFWNSCCIYIPKYIIPPAQSVQFYLHVYDFRFGNLVLVLVGVLYRNRTNRLNLYIDIERRFIRMVNRLWSC